MKPVLDKEIDSLLRRSAATALWPEGGSAPASAREPEHLDADELSAYAENALPAAARTRFASHLADCAECRKIVVELTVAADAAGGLENRAAVVPFKAARIPAWQVWLGALFAPRVMRYAMPLVAFCIVGAITFIALRTRQADHQTALQTSQSENRPAAISNESSPATTSSNATTMENSAPATATTDTAKTNTANIAKPAPLSSTTNANSSTATDALSAIKKDVSPPPPAVSGKIEEKEVAANSPQPKAETAPAITAGAAVSSNETVTVTRDEAQKAASKDAERNQKARSEVASSDEVTRQAEAVKMSNNGSSQLRNAQSPDGSRGAQRSAADSAGSGAASSSASAPAPREARADRRSRAMEAKRDDKEKKSLAKDAGGMRGVSGHRFQKRDGVWVDVNYKSTMAMTGVRRDTEGYRALIADIPELRRIADQLGGELIVVVKGRAYRIR